MSVERHLWTPRDLARWRALLPIARKALAAAELGPVASPAAMGELARAARRIFPVSFPSRSLDDWHTLLLLQRQALGFALARWEEREALTAPLAASLEAAALILGAPRGVAASCSPPAPPPASPARSWWLEGE